MGMKKRFVLDTNVILHDYKCLDYFQENDIFLPIVVLEELDRFKKGNEQINFNARAFIRELEERTDNNLFTEGVSLGEGRGRLFLYVEETMHAKVCKAYRVSTPDNIILSTVMTIMDKYAGEKVIFVTKDVNLRMKARALGIETEDYINDKVKNIDIFESAQRSFEDVDPTLIDKLYGSKYGLALNSFPFADEIVNNECFILESGQHTALARYDAFSERVVVVNKEKRMGIEPRNAEQTFAMEMLINPDIKLVGISGKAGTGKTLLALAAALSQTKLYKQILLARPIVSLSNKDIGFLPGDEKQKVAPYMQPLFDNLTVIKHQFSASSPEVRRIEEMQNSEELVIEALAFIRGRSLSDTYFIVDEAQNLTPHEVKTIITRAGEGTKVVFTGDIEQIDSPYLDSQSNGLAYMIDRMRGQKLFAHVNLIKGERSELSELASDLL